MTTTTVPTFTSRATRSDAVTTPVWRVGAFAGLAAAVATTAVGLGARAIDIPMKAAPQNADAGQAIPLSGYAMGTVLCTAVGTVLAIVLARRARRPAATFLVITTVLTLASFAGPITTGHATTATRLVLSLTHVVAAAIVIPALTLRLGSASGKRSARS